jgi:hypothetical protein
MQWGDRHLSGSAGPPLAVEHGGCAAPVHIVARCADGHEVDPDEIVVRAHHRTSTPGAK